MKLSADQLRQLLAIVQDAHAAAEGPTDFARALINELESELYFTSGPEQRDWRLADKLSCPSDGRVRGAKP